MFSSNYFSKTHIWRILVFCLVALASTASVLATVTVARAAILAVPLISVTKSDTIIDDGVLLAEAADGKADPGETIEYTVVINNSGTDATGLTYTDTIDLNTTLSGSASVSPVAINDTLPVTVTGNVAISTALMATPFSVITNDYQGQNMSPGLTILGPATFLSTQGGNVTMTLSGAGIGQFTYDPPAGFEGTDTFTYVLSDNTNASSAVSNRTATVSITVSGMIWFVNNNAISCTTNGCGRLSNPYSTLAAFNAANDGIGNHPAANDNIFMYESATPYTGGLTLLSGQKLIGQDSTQTLSAISGISPVTGSLTLPAMNATPAQSTIIQNAGGNGVTLNTGNALNGFTASNASSSAISGSGFGTLTAADVIVDTNGQALSLTNGTLSAVFPSVTSTGGTNNVALTGPLTGTLTIGAGALSGATGNAFNVNGGSATINNTATIASGSARSVNVTGLTGGTVTFSGAITDTDTGISLTTNTGATINFTGALTLSTGANTAFNATGGGTISATNTASTATTTTATAVNVANTTIGASNLIFRSISSNGGSATGIILDNTGSSGGLQVLGDGSNTAFGGNGSGGTITNKSGTDGNNATGVGIYLNNTSHVVLRRMNLSNFNNFAIRGLNVNNFILEYCTINHSSGKIGDNAAIDEGSVYFGIENPGGTNGLTGTATVTSCLIEDGFENNFKIANLSGTLSQFTMTGSTVRDTSTVSPGNNGLEFRVQGTANVTADITTSTFTGNRANGIQVTTTTEHTGTVDVEIGTAGVAGSGGTFTNNNIGVNIAHGSAGTLNFDVHRGTYNSSPGLASPININLAAGGGGPMSGWVTNNTITNANSLTGPGIRVTTNGTDADNSNVLTIAVINNNISLVGNRGIEMIARDGNSAINATINNNVVQLTDVLSADGIRVDAGATSTDTNSICLAIYSNDSDTAGVGLNGIRIRNRFAGTTFRLPSYGGPATDPDGTHDLVINHLVGLNGLSSNISADHAVGNSGFTSGAPCATPVGRQPSGNDILAQAQPESNPQAELAIAPQAVSVSGRSRLDSIVRSAVVEAPVIAPLAQAPDANLGGSKPLFALAQPAPSLSGENVTVNIGTLPAGKSVTITFRVTVDALDTGEIRTRILNQGTVSGSNFATLTTTDPSPNADPFCLASPSVGTQTCTPVDRPDTTVVSLTRQSANPNRNASVTWQVVFADPVASLVNSNFTLVSGGSVSGASISSVTESSGPPSTTWNITATTGSGDGTLELRMANDTGLSHDVTNQPYTQPASGAVYTLDKTAPTTTSFVRQSPVSSPTNADILVFRATFSEEVTAISAADFAVTGTTATISAVDLFSPGVYDITVSGGDLAGLDGVVALNFSGIMDITDLAGNALANTEPATDETYTLDNTPPSTVSFARQLPLASLTNADTLVFRATFSEAVTGVDVSDFAANGTTGTPTSVAPISTSVYDITVSGGNLTSYNGVVGLDFSATPTIEDQIGNLLPGTDPATDETYTLDNTSPAVTDVSSTKTDGIYTVGEVIPVTVMFSEAVTVTGTPQLTLETGATDAVVNYTSGSGTTVLTFEYTVQVGNISADLDYVGTTSLALNSGTVTDTATNNANLALAVPGETGSLGANKAIVIDTAAPIVTNVTSTKADGSYGTGVLIPITVTFNEAVTVTGTPQLTLETGMTDRVVNYSSGSGTDTLTFNYTTQTGDTSADLDYAGTTSLALNSGTIRDAATNNAVLTLPIPGDSGSLGANKAIVLDATEPTVTNVSSTKADGFYKAGENIPVTVTFSEDVTVTGTPQLTLETGASDAVVDYTSGSGTATLTFTYVVQAGHASVDLDYTGTTALALNSGTIQDVSLNDAVLTLPAPGAAGSLSANKSLVIDTAAPMVTNVTSAKPDGTYSTGEVIAIEVIFSEAVTVSGSPQLTLETGTTDALVNYSSGSGTNTLIFDYTVQAGDTSADLDYISATALALNSGLITDVATNNATLALPAPGAAGSLGANKALVIDTLAPTVNNVTSSKANGAYTIGESIAVTVTFSESVTVSGTPQLTLETGATDRVINYASGSGTPTLTFNYVVQAGDTSADLDYISPAALSLNSGSVRDESTNDAILTLPIPGDAGSLGVNKAIVIDTTTPDTTITANPVDPASSDAASFTFIGSDAGGSGIASFECDLDSGGFSACASPVDFTGLTDGSHTFEVRAIDNAGNVDGSPDSFTWVVDATEPDTTITANPADPTNTTAANFTFTGNDGSGVGGLTFECRLDGGAFAACDTSSTQQYTGLSDGSHTFEVRAIDAVGNVDSTPASYTWMVDTSQAGVVVSSTVTSPTNLSPITITITFDEPVTGFTPSVASGDIVIGGVGGADSNPQMVSSTVYTFDLTPSGQGVVTVTVPDGSAQDGVGNWNTVSNTFSITYDTTAPTVTINQAVGQSDPTGISPINFTVVFSETMTGFTGADVVLSGTSDAASAVVTEIAPNDGTTYNVAVSGMTTSGTVIASIPADIASDAAANLNVASTSTDNIVNYNHDIVPPVVVSSLRVNPDPTSAASVSFIVTFSEPVTGVDVSDFGLTTSGVQSASISGLSGSGAVYTVTVSTGSGNGSIRLDVLDNDTIVDAVLNTLAGGFTGGEAYTILGRQFIFADVPYSYWANSYIERLYNAGITGGCSTNPLLIYCPNKFVTRAEMAVFILKSIYGPSYSPPPATGLVFDDVPATYWAAAWIEQLQAEGVTAGCGNGSYCPDQTATTRAQMAVFLLRGKYGSGYNPPAPSGVFSDVPTDYWAAAWIEQLAAEGITAGCGAGKYCPDNPLTRAEMAVFLVRTFNLP